MGNVNHDNAGEPGHGVKLSENDWIRGHTGVKFLLHNDRVPHWEKTMVPVPSVPGLVSPGLVSSRFGFLVPDPCLTNPNVPCGGQGPPQL